MKIITNSCERVSGIENVLRSTNKAWLVDKKDVPLFETQVKIPSGVITHIYEVTTDNTIRILARFTKVKFVYDMRVNRAEIYISDEVLKYLDSFMPDDVREGLDKMLENGNKKEEVSEANV